MEEVQKFNKIPTTQFIAHCESEMPFLFPIEYDQHQAQPPHIPHHEPESFAIWLLHYDMNRFKVCLFIYLFSLLLDQPSIRLKRNLAVINES